jgi:hypothetical protein
LVVVTQRTHEPEIDMKTAELRSALTIMAAAVDVVRELGRVPSGHLYAMLMNSLDETAYESMLRQVLRTGLVKRDGDVLVWVG